MTTKYRNYVQEICDSCTRRRCKFTPKNNKCAKFAPAQTGWKIEEIYHEKEVQRNG